MGLDIRGRMQVLHFCYYFPNGSRAMTLTLNPPSSSPLCISQLITNPSLWAWGLVREQRRPLCPGGDKETWAAHLSALSSLGCTSVIRCLSPGVCLKGGHEKSTPIRAVSLEAEIISQASQSRCRAILGQQSQCAEEGASPLLKKQGSSLERANYEELLPAPSVCAAEGSRASWLWWLWPNHPTTGQGVSPIDVMIGAQFPGLSKNLPAG